MNICGYGERYLTASKFINLCDELKIKKLGSSIKEDWLEFLEKNKILFPEFRIKLPIEYARIIDEINYTNPNKKIPPRWHSLDSFIKYIDQWKFTYHIFHPFDKDTKCTYLQTPLYSRFRKWKTKPNKAKNSFSVDRQINYYSYWKAYYVYEITKACTCKYMINSFDIRNIKSLIKHGINKKIILSYNIPIYKQALINEIKSNVKMFNTLSFYIYSYKRSDNIPLWKFRDYLKLEGKSKKDFDDRNNYQKKRIALYIKSKFDVEKNETIEFLKYLTKKYFLYKEEHKEKLAGMIRNDIMYLIKFLSDVFNLSREVIIEGVGRIPESRFNKPLEFLLKGEIAEAKEELIKNFRLILNEMTFLKISIKDIIDFIKFCEENEYDYIYLVINRKYWGFNKYFDLIENLSAISLAFESYLRNILIKTKNYKTKTNNLKYFINVLEQFYKGEKWVCEMRDKWQELTDTSYTLEENILRIKKYYFRSFPEFNNIRKALLIAGATRTAIAHSAFEISFEKISINECFDNIFISIFYSWQYAKEKFSFLKF